jgi:acyl-CoA thioesterase-2
MFALEPHGPDTFVGQGPRYPWGGLYGGQIVAQALRAAARTVEPQFHAHALHAFFIRRGDHNEPIRFEVERLRNGRSFVTRAVVARQASGAILNLAGSFQVDESGPDIQTSTAPVVPEPGGLEVASWSPMFDRRNIVVAEPGVVRAWFRAHGPVGDDPIDQGCALAYLSDDLPTEAVARLHPSAGSLGEDNWMGASLDHAMWFHRPVRADDWTLWEFRCRELRGSRGLGLGEVFSADGVHLATVAQEVLVRVRDRA